MREKPVEIEEKETAVETPLDVGHYAILTHELSGTPADSLASELPKSRLHKSRTDASTREDTLCALSHQAWSLLSGGKAAGFQSKLARQLGKLAIIPSRLRTDTGRTSTQSASTICKLSQLLEEIAADDELSHRKQIVAADKLREGRKKLERLLGL